MTVPKMEFPTATVKGIFHNLIVISVGILPETVGIMDTIYICWLRPILKVTFLFFLY